MGVLAAKQMGAARIIAMSRHKTRQDLALEFGATDIVSERGEAGVARIKELTDGVGADSVLECVGTRESMMQALQCARPGAMVGYVGVPHGVDLRWTAVVLLAARPDGRSGAGAPFPARSDRPGAGARDQPGQGVRPAPAARRRRRGLSRDGRASRDQDAAARSDGSTGRTHAKANTRRERARSFGHRLRLHGPQLQLRPCARATRSRSS